MPENFTLIDADYEARLIRGRIVIVGYTSGVIPSVKTNYIMIKNIAVSGLSAANYLERRPEETQRAQAELFDLYAKGKLKPHVMKTYPLKDYAEALKVIRQRGIRGKVVLTMER